ncbi:hypothetical protein Trichorick_01432 (plasmid) [Candidatus Trichorickettsia mobilis]|uniref:Uncharacterized protein n=1 Tax=Candidatus Trichorickettsia mobilis TaxID=1346319 RepID=A0ABZ0UU09_9RICK|nr:hypothetical protein [Candidatus Trichorickettsia mobilis]WPY01519.1 hypothetical protein Trichorick_01432 [Candidatus Trichorickettsia mobilis]
MAIKYKPLLTIKEKTATDPAVFQSLSTEITGTTDQIKVDSVASAEYNGEDYKIGLPDNVMLPGQYVGIPKVTTLPVEPKLCSLFILEKTIP